MASHLSNEHPEYSKNPQAIKFSITRTGPKCLERQVREAVQLANMDPERIINTHMEFVAPAIQGMTSKPPVQWKKRTGKIIRAELKQ